MATINIQDKGATPNDGAEDTQAIRDAVNAANPGDTVYCPGSGDNANPNVYLINNLDRVDGAAAVRIWDGSEGINVVGDDARDTVIKFTADQGQQSASMLRVFNENSNDNALNHDGMEITDITFDGNADGMTDPQSDTQKGLVFGQDATGYDQNILVKNVVITNQWAMGVRSGMGQITYDRCDVTKFGRRYQYDNGSRFHGINLKQAGGATPPAVQNSFFDGDKFGGHPVDTQGGEVKLDTLYTKNSQFGTKIQENSTVTITNCHFAGAVDYVQADYPDGNNYKSIHQSPTQDTGTVTLNNVKISDWGWAGWGTNADSDASGNIGTFNGGTVLVEGVNSTGSSDGGMVVNYYDFSNFGTIGIRDVQNGDAVDLAANGQNCTGDIDEIQYENVASGNLGNTANVTVANTATTVTVDPTVPAASDVGIYTEGGGGVAAALPPTARGGGTRARGGATGYK
jgi:hypothetical protein